MGFACAASRARSGLGWETGAGGGADGKRPRPTENGRSPLRRCGLANPVGCPPPRFSLLAAFQAFALNLYRLNGILYFFYLIWNRITEQILIIIKTRQ